MPVCLGSNVFAVISKGEHLFIIPRTSYGKVIQPRLRERKPPYYREQPNSFLINAAHALPERSNDFASKGRQSLRACDAVQPANCLEPML